MSEGFACVYVCVPHAHLVPAEVRRSPGTGWMWAHVGAGNRAKVLTRATRACNPWAICPLTDSCWGHASHLAHGRQGKLLSTFSPTELLNKLSEWKYKNWALSSNLFLLWYQWSCEEVHALSKEGREMERHESIPKMCSDWRVGTTFALLEYPKRFASWGTWWTSVTCLWS